MAIAQEDFTAGSLAQGVYERWLDLAEEPSFERGFDGAAGRNVASVSYY